MLKKNKDPFIDIVIPNYNKGNYLDKAIKSVINQTYNKWKLYIVDDNSNDSSLKILRKYKKNNKIKIFYLNKNQGPSFCRNLGVSKTSSRFIAFLDSDDFWPNNKLSSQINFMNKNNLSFTYTDYKTFYQNSKYKKKYTYSNVPEYFTFKSFIRNSSINTSTLIIKKDLIKNIKFKNLQKHEDYIFKCEILKKNKKLIAKKFSKTFAYYRILKNSRSQNKLMSLFYLWKYNRKFNKLNFLENLISVVLISLNSIKKYGFKTGV